MPGNTPWTLGIFWAFLTLIFLTNVEGFLPDRITFQVKIADSDYTLKDLTEESITRVVAKFFEDSKPDRYKPGDLTKLDPLTPSSLFSKHFGDCVSSENFKEATQEIVDANLYVNRRYRRTSDWHFNAEKITQGNVRLISLRSTILTSLNADQPDYAGVRENIGRYLHLLQDFYSNTNWVELQAGHLIPNINTQLGMEQLSDPIAAVQDNTCRNCRGILLNTRPQSLDCVREKNYDPSSQALFSGYRSGQDITKPESDDTVWGKCSHGGELDTTFIQVATGGINKETSNPSISPHHHLHDEAASLALQASEGFFNDEVNGIIAQVGNDKFRQLMNLNSGSALVLVIDDTGSMSEEIDAVVNSAIELVTRTAGTCFASAQYIVSPFNDPDHGPLTVTTDPDVCIAALRDLYAHAGGDCPELCMTGIEVALQRVSFASDVYVWTDADDKDSAKLPDVQALATEKNAKLNFLTTGSCGRRRKKRGVSNSYDTLSEATGGTIYEADNFDIGSVSDIIIADTLASEVSVIRWISDNFTDVSLEIPVDNTIDDLSITVSGPTPRADTTIFDPSGTEVQFSSDFIEVIVDTANVFTFLVSVKNSTGTWRLNLNGISLSEVFDVEVSARSFFDFFYHMFKKDSAGNVLPVEGLPLAGANVTFVIDTISPELINSTDELRLYDSDGRQVLVNSRLTTVGGRSTGLYVSEVTLPYEAFMISVIGTDSDGNLVKRLNSAVVQVLGFSLGFANDNTMGDLVPGGSTSFGIVLGNLGASDTFDLSFSVTTRSSAVANPVTGNVQPSSLILAETGSAQGQVTLQANGAAAVGDSVLATVTMKSRTTLEENFVSQSIILAQPIQVVEDPEDIATPTCSVTESTGSCSIDMINNNCASHMWSIRVSLQDDRAVAKIVVSDYEESGGQYNLSRSDSSNIDLIYESNCCCPNVSVTVTDIVGNTDRCGVDYFTPVVGEVWNVLQCVRDCDDTTLCQNGGLCIGGKCDCAYGFNGTLCEHDIDFCMDHNCMHGGECFDQVQGYRCNCTDTGYEGYFCEIDIDDCKHGPCANGECVDGLKQFYCNCSGSGFQGDYCEIDINECIEGVCLNGGICTNLNGSYNCDCKPGWRGINCGTNLNECVENDPCENNSTCEDTDGSYKCLCPLGFNGTNCETDIDECASSPCQFSSICIDMVDQYTCDCERTGYEGIHCNQDIDECDINLNNCHPNASCSNTNGGFNCSCTNGFEGDGVNCNLCTSDRYGSQCGGICTCVDGADCHHVHGICSCNEVLEDQECNKANLKATIEISPALNEIFDGASVNLTCQVNLPAKDINAVMWTLPDNSTIVSAFDGNDDGKYELHLTEVQPLSHSGEYTCTAETVLQTGESIGVRANVNIDVKAPGRIINAPGQQLAELQETAEFNCSVFGNTAPSISWHGTDGGILNNRVDTNIVILESFNSSVFRTSSLRIHNITRMDNGTYVCNVTNTMNIESDEQRHDFGEYHLFVFERPEIAVDAVRTISNSEISVGWSIVFAGNLEVENCSIGYTKTIDGDRRATETTNSTSMFTIYGLDPYTEYTVDVTCRNLVGASETVEYEGPQVRTKQSEPGKPKDIRLREVTQSSVVIHWNDPDLLNGPIAFYIVEVESDNEQTMSSQTSGKQSSLKVDNLDPATNYTVYVRAANMEDGNEYLGNRTDGVLFATLQAPPTEPINVETTDNGTTCKITWDKPNKSNGVIEDYTIYWSVKGRDGSATQMKSGSDVVPGGSYEFSYKKASLIAYSIYSFNVTARTTVGEGLPSEPVVMCQTPPGVPTEPINVETTDNGTTCKITWDKPNKSNGVIEDYTIYWSVKGRDGSATQMKSGSDVVPGGSYEFSYKKTSLIAYSIYSFNVTARTTVGEGLPSEPVVMCQTPPGAPEDKIQTPLTVQEDTPNRVTTSTFKMMVAPASTRNGPIGCYEIVVIPLEKGASSPSGDPDVEHPPNRITDYATSGARPGYPYSAIVIEGSELSEPTEIVIGDKTVTTCTHDNSSRRKREANNKREAENGPLMPGTTYTTFTRAFVATEDGSMMEYSSSLYMVPVSTNPSKNSNAAWIAVGVIVAVLVIVVIVVVLVYRRRKSEEENNSSPSLAEKGTDVELFGIDKPGGKIEKTDSSTNHVENGDGNEPPCTDHQARELGKRNSSTSSQAENDKDNAELQTTANHPGNDEKDTAPSPEPANTEDDNDQPDSANNPAKKPENSNILPTCPEETKGDVVDPDIDNQREKPKKENSSPPDPEQNGEDIESSGCVSPVESEKA